MRVDLFPSDGLECLDEFTTQSVLDVIGLRARRGVVGRHVDFPDGRDECYDLNSKGLLEVLFGDGTSGNAT